MRIKTEIKIRICNDSPDGERYYFMGPGMHALLSEIQKSGSVALACSNLDLSYSKGWKMIKNAEKGFGKSLVVRHQGGTGGGSATITDDAVSLLKAYENAHEEIVSVAERIVNKNFKDVISDITKNLK